MLARHFAIATLGLPLQLKSPVHERVPHYPLRHIKPEHPFKTNRRQFVALANIKILVSVAFQSHPFK
jgi:hypothetical protein